MDMADCCSSWRVDEINLMQMCRLISLKDDQFVEIKLYYLHLKSVFKFFFGSFFCY